MDMSFMYEIEGIYFLLTLLILPFLISTLLKTFKRSSSNTPPLPPGPTPWPLIGNIFHIGKMPHIDLANFAKTHGPLISLKLGTKYVVVGSSQAAAIEILKKHDRSFSARHVPQAYPFTREELNEISIGWTQQCDDRWKALRTLCRTELFSGKALDSQEDLRRKKVKEMVEFLKGKEGNVVNIAQLSFATVLNTMGNLLVSQDLISLGEEVSGNTMRVLIRQVMDVGSAPDLSDLYPILGKLDLQGLRKKARKTWQTLWSMWEPIVEEKRKRKNETSSHRDFLDILVDRDFSNDGILELLVELFSAATDTTTSTTEWLMAELIRNPDALKSARKELDKENWHNLEESRLMNLPYLQACLKETLRLHPPAPLLLPGRAPETCQVMNYTIPKNSQIFVNVWAIARDPTIWDEPLKFKPERFLDSSVDFKGNNFELLPFGAGRRICPGLPMAARNVTLLVASLIHFFDWSLPEGKEPNEMDMNEIIGITLQKEHPLLLIPRARK